MANDAPSATSITRPDFDALLSQYPALVGEISKTKGSKPAQRSLQKLDVYRYDEAPAQFTIDGEKAKMTLEDIKHLVEWKLRHGKFRPTLMGLVTSNDPNTAAKTVQEALTAYGKPSGKKPGNVAAAMTVLTKMRGIGPATAALLLSVHDAERVIFFSDEVFWWLCCDGKRGAPIKYNPKEYESLRGEANMLMSRLSVSATDVEKVAYVLMKRDAGESLASSTKGKLETTKKVLEKNKSTTKRKSTSVTETTGGTRKSKRTRS